MIFDSILDKLQFTITICMSFLIAIFSLSLNKISSKDKIRGIFFLIPFIVSVYSFLFFNGSSFRDVFRMAEFIMIITLLCYTVIKYSDIVYQLGILFLLLIIPTILYCSTNYIEAVNIFYNIVVIAYGILFIICLYLLRTIKNSDVRLIFGLFLLIISNALSIMLNNYYLLLFSIFLRLCAYIVFFGFIYRTTYNSIMHSVHEANMLKKTLEKQLNYEVKKRTLEIEKSNERLLKLSQIDPLTRVYNKKAILHFIEKQLLLQRGRQFSMLMFDIDHFKHINDSYGHIKGDMCIKTLSNIASTCIREEDALGRYGGDEFIAVLPSLSLTEAFVVAERIKKKVNETENPKLTVSIGIATFPQDGRTAEELIAIADKGMYISKHKGRNTISHHKFF